MELRRKLNIHRNAIWIGSRCRRCSYMKRNKQWNIFPLCIIFLPHFCLSPIHTRFPSIKINNPLHYYVCVCAEDCSKAQTSRQQTFFSFIFHHSRNVISLWLWLSMRCCLRRSYTKFSSLIPHVHTNDEFTKEYLFVYLTFVPALLCANII